jgi:gliding motility-associated-like protein
MKHLLLLMIFLGVAFPLAQAQSSNSPTVISGQAKGQDNASTQAGDAAAVDIKEGVPLFIPNAFTPNADGINDFFFIPNAVLSNFSIAILDRWGNEVFRSNTAAFRWDGQVGTRPAPEGTYIYALEGTTADGRHVKRSGTVSVMR